MITAADSALVAALVPARNVEARRGVTRPDILLIHYTGMVSCARAIDWLAREESRVSCHYVIDTDGTITQMVGESERAWHAGVGTWHGDSDINSRSIGIEIHNPGHELGYPDFPSAQMQAVIALAHDIVRRSAIPPERVLAHSDIAPDRKIDPGEKFSWSYLAARGIGHWVAPTPVSVRDPGEGPGSTAAAVGTAQRLLAAYGYGVPRTGMLDAPTTAVVAAFQRHFRPERVDGRIDGSTLDTLARLVEALPRA